MLISAPNFMKKCDVVMDPSFGNIDMSQDLSNKTIFINGDFFEHFVPKLIQYSNLTLVIHHSDRFFDRIKFEAIRPCVSKVLAQNCDWYHPRVFQIPIGFRDAPPIPGPFMTKTRMDENLIKTVRTLDIEKDIHMYVNVNLHGDEPKFAFVRALRQNCLDAFPAADMTRRPFPEFLNILRRSKYVACPMGFGIDTHRFFEAAYMKARPVVITSGMDPLYKKFGAVIVNDWTDPLPEWSEPDVPEEMFHTDFWITS